MKELEQLPIPLLTWYREHARVLPWRSDPTPYHVWLSEIMLQQTRVAAVMEYYRRFLAALPTVADLAAVEEDQLMKLWQGLGYYNRARNLQKAARQVMEDWGGQFPRTYKDLRTLAGVGDYTAGAIASIAFGEDVPAVDGNVLRVVTRITGDSGDITRADTKERIRAALADILPRGMAGEFNQAMMDLGATVCLPNGAPLCGQCPAEGFCTAHREERTGELPVKAAKRPRRVEERTVFLLFHGGRVALRRRGEKGLLAGLWEYPNEFSPASDALAAWGIEPAAEEFGGTGKHIFTHIEWHMTARLIETKGEALPEGWVWAGREELRREYAVPNAFQSFQYLVEERLRDEEPSF
ncbi:MAG TPA: A/G-specific adenine glycosylase [Candidatus Galloscillospira excrementavium]|nr:A/G-specific adenine glycosylase [Candidatus Galloscillospira excrementavium]